MSQLYPQAPGSLFVTFYYWQGYRGGILTRLHTGTTELYCVKTPKTFIMKLLLVCWTLSFVFSIFKLYDVSELFSFPSDRD
jgi:hypothetical protein